MKKYIEIAEEVLVRLVDGKCVKGSLQRDLWTGRMVFKAYNIQSPRAKDRVICHLENGWLKESAKRIKFFTSAKKELGRRWINVMMHRELKEDMDAMEVREIIDRV